jgi:hypothetical protein
VAGRYPSINIFASRLSGRGQGCQMVYIFSNQKYQFGKILEGLRMSNVGTYVYFVPIWNILRPFGILLWSFGHFVVILYIFPVLVNCVKNIWQPLDGGDQSGAKKSMEMR